MDTAQLVVLWYAGLLIEGLLLVRGIDSGGVLFPIAAIALLAALTIYTLKPHPLARKRWVAAGTIVPPLLFGVGLWAYQRHEERIAAERETAGAEKTITDPRQRRVDRVNPVEASCFVASQTDDGERVRVQLPDRTIVDLGANPAPELKARFKAKILVKWPELAPDVELTAAPQLPAQGEAEPAARHCIAPTSPLRHAPVGTIDYEYLVESRTYEAALRAYKIAVATGVCE